MNSYDVQYKKIPERFGLELEVERNRIPLQVIRIREGTVAVGIWEVLFLC